MRFNDDSSQWLTVLGHPVVTDIKATHRIFNTNLYHSASSIPKFHLKSSFIGRF